VPRRPSPQTRAVLAELLRAPDHWQYGFTLAKTTGQPSGTLYPILARLSDGGLLESRWEPNPREGRPARHMYRLTAAGQSYARAAAAAPASRSRRAELGWQA
jgi:PadR family transcriptional regulator